MARLKSQGRGFRKRNKGGSKGGVGNGGRWDHKRASFRKSNFKNKKIVNFFQIERDIEKLQKKGYVRLTKQNIPKVYFTEKFLNKTSKILGQGQPSYRYCLPKSLKVSRSVKRRLTI